LRTVGNSGTFSSAASARRSPSVVKALAGNPASIFRAAIALHTGAGLPRLRDTSFFKMKANMVARDV
jgi:hypothetical protein